MNVLPLHSPSNPSNNNTQGYPPLQTMPPNQPDRTTQTPKAKGIARLTVEVPLTFRGENAGGDTKPRWWTTEFKLYYLVALFAVPAMFWIPISISQGSHPNFPFYASRLSPGWINGRLVDNSDAQYRSFRDNVPILCKAALGYLAIKYTSKYLLSATTSFVKLIPINFVLSLVMIVALHGSSSLKILVIMSINYLIAKKLHAYRFSPVVTWTFNLFVLFMNEIYHGYHFASISPSLSFLDSYSGVYPRWHINFNITMLRLISFNMDYYWALEKSAVDVKGSPDKQRVAQSHSEDQYSYMNYLTYILYPPLYIAGPIITFNDFMWQHKNPVRLDTRFKFMYMLRFIICYLTMEFILHFMYVVAIKDRKAWLGDSPAEIAMISFWNLIIVWLKLLIPWRFFRLWALLDGIDPPENMVRCMANNYSAFGFWRSWHRSYNLWIIRYIYVPLGGKQHVLLNTLLVFSFVALWHDLTFRLLAWGWLVSLFVLPEMVAAYLLPAKKYGKNAWYRHVCAIGAVLNIVLMITANLVGFVTGTDGVKFFFGQLFGTSEGIRFMVLCLGILFVGAQLMFEYREDELRQGIVRRC